MPHGSLLKAMDESQVLSRCIIKRVNAFAPVTVGCLSWTVEDVTKEMSFWEVSLGRIKVNSLSS